MVSRMCLVIIFLLLLMLLWRDAFRVSLPAKEAHAGIHFLFMCCALLYSEEHCRHFYTSLMVRTFAITQQKKTDLWVSYLMLCNKSISLLPPHWLRKYWPASTRAGIIKRDMNQLFMGHSSSVHDVCAQVVIDFMIEDYFSLGLRALHMNWGWSSSNE